MSKLSFRARALDPSKPMPIYLAEELPDLPEYSAINRAVPQMPSGMEKEEESEHHLQRAICTGLIIPTPEVFTTDQECYDRNYPPTYKMPRQLIHMQPLGLEQDTPDYDMDSADELWVNSQLRRLDLTPLKFELMMDRLEKSSGQTVVTLNEAKALLKQDDEVSIAVYDYWLNKRLKMQHPLILSVKTENRSGAAANNPYLAFRRRTEKMQTRKNRKNDETSYEKMLKLRRDLSRAVTLLEMVKRREKTKREQLHLSIEVFEKRYQIRDFSGSLISELNSNVKSSRPAFAPLYTNQYSHHSTMSQSGLITSSSAAAHHYSTSQYLNSTGMVPSTAATVGATKRDLDSGSRKEKRQYKKRKHKIQRDKQFTVPSSSPAAVESTISSDEEDLAGNHMAGSEGEDEGLYAFRRNKNCEYHKPLTKELGNWPWESKEDNGSADPKYRFALASIRHPRSRCVGFARRRLGRGGRVILDRISTNMDDLWSQLDYTIYDNKQSKSTINPGENENENMSRDTSYISSSTEPIVTPAATWNNFHRRNISQIVATTAYNNNNNLNNNLSSNMENNSISNCSSYLLNKEIKREQIEIDDEDWMRQQQQQQQQQQLQLRQHLQLQPINPPLSDIVVDLVRNHCKNSDLSNRNINNNYNIHTNSSSDNIRTILGNNSNDKVVIKNEHSTVIKQENSDSDLNNILDDENVNLARLSSFINATKTPTGVGGEGGSDVVGLGLDIGGAFTNTNAFNDESEKFIKSELIRAESCDLTGQLTNSNYNINNCHKLFRSSSLPQDLYNNVVIKNQFQQRTDSVQDIVDNSKDCIYNEFLQEIRKDWLHFRPKTPLPQDNQSSASASASSPQCSQETDVNELTLVDFTEQTPIAIELQRVGSSSPPTSVFTTKCEIDPMFVTNPFTYNDLAADEQLMNSPADSLNSGIDFNLSGDSLNELNLSLGEDDNEKMLDNILQECQIDDLKALNQTTNFWNGILDDGGLLDVIEDKKIVPIEPKDSGIGEFLINGGSGLAEEKDGSVKKLGKRKSSIKYRFGNSHFSVGNTGKDELFFRKDEPKNKLIQPIKIEPPEEILAPPRSQQHPQISSTTNNINMAATNSLQTHKILSSSGSLSSSSIIAAAPTATNQATILTNLNTATAPKIYIKQEPGQVPTNINQSQLITLSNIKLENDVASSGIINHPAISSNMLGDSVVAGGIVSSVSSSLVTPKHHQPQHILQQITQNPQIINVSISNLAVNDSSGTIVLAGNSSNKRQINGPSDRNAIQNILKKTNRKFQISQQQPMQSIKQDDDGMITTSGIVQQQKTTTQSVQQAGNYIKMSTYPVVVSDLNVQQQNTLSASALAVASNHNYSLQPSAQAITIIGPQQSGNKIIINSAGGSTGSSGNFTITTPIQDIQNKIHYNQIPTSNIKVNLVTNAGMQQGSLLVDQKNASDVAKISNQQQQQHHQQQQQLQQQQHIIPVQQQQQQQQQQGQPRIKLEKTLNMYIDSDQKRVLYTKLVNLATLQQHKNNSGQQTVQVTPGTAQLINKTHSVQRLANVGNMRPLSQVVASSSANMNSVAQGSSSDISSGSGGISGSLGGGVGLLGHKQQNNNSNDALSATTVSGGINLNTTNR